MSSPRHASLAHEDLSTPAQMHDDCRAVLERAARAATRPAPSLHFDEQPGEGAKRGPEFSTAAARLAAAVYGD